MHGIFFTQVSTIIWILKQCWGLVFLAYFLSCMGKNRTFMVTGDVLIFLSGGLDFASISLLIVWDYWCLKFTIFYNLPNLHILLQVVNTFTQKFANECSLCSRKLQNIGREWCGIHDT